MPNVQKSLSKKQVSDQINAALNRLEPDDPRAEPLINFKKNPESQKAKTWAVLALNVSSPVPRAVHASISGAGQGGTAVIRDLKALGFPIEYSTKSKTDTLSSVIPVLEYQHRRAHYTPKEWQTMKKIAATNQHGVDAFNTSKKLSSTDPEAQLDHRIPMIRQTVEEKVDVSNSAAVLDAYMLVSKESNMQKNSICTTCVSTGVRGYYPALGRDAGSLYTVGDNKYDEKVGCCGCPLYDPQGLRDYLGSKNAIQ